MAQRPHALALSLLAGAATAAGLFLHARRNRERGRGPGGLRRHPLVAGLAAGIVAWLLQRKR